MAKLYSLLSSSDNAELEQISRAMTTDPRMISDYSRFDTEVILASHGQVISKGGAEGIQCLCKVNEGIGLALKVEDGSKRAKQAVGLHLLKQLEWKIVNLTWRAITTILFLRNIRAWGI